MPAAGRAAGQAPLREINKEKSDLLKQSEGARAMQPGRHLICVKVPSRYDRSPNEEAHHGRSEEPRWTEAGGPAARSIGAEAGHNNRRSRRTLRQGQAGRPDVQPGRRATAANRPAALELFCFLPAGFAAD